MNNLFAIRSAFEPERESVEAGADVDDGDRFGGVADLAEGGEVRHVAVELEVADEPVLEEPVVVELAAGELPDNSKMLEIT